MITLTLTDLNQGQSLTHTWMYIAPVKPNIYPIDHGYRIQWQSLYLGDCKVLERRVLKVGNISDMMAYQVCGYGLNVLLRKMRDAGISTEADATVYLFQFQYMHYYEGFKKALHQALEVNMAKNTNNKNFQYAI
jgi:hypothetical protein